MALRTPAPALLISYAYLWRDQGATGAGERVGALFARSDSPAQLDLAASISEETGPEATIDALMSVIAYSRISPDRAKAILACCAA